jgi:hypothetical protein
MSVHGNTVSKQILAGAWSSTRTGPRPKKGIGPWVYRWGLRRRHSFNLWLHTTVFQPEKYAIKARLYVENMKMGHRQNIYIPSNSQVIRGLDNFQINCKLVWDCHQSLVKLSEHNRIQMVWVPGHMGLM